LLRAYVGQCLARPALQRAEAIETADVYWVNSHALTAILVIVAAVIGR